MSETQNLINDVEAYLEKWSVSPTAFGDAALGDRHFVRQLRSGRRCWPETESKVREYMRTAKQGAA